MLLGPFVGRLSTVAKNDEAAYLPVNAEATVVDRAAAKFRDQDLQPTVVVYESPTTLTSADLARIRADMAALTGLDAVAGPPQGPRLSKDGKAAEVLVQVRATGPTGALDGVRAIRRTVDRTGTTNGYVTGPGGFQADANAVFQYIDGLLLLVALGVVFVLLILVYRSPLLPVVVLLTAGLAVSLAGSVVYLLARHGIVTLNGQSQGILMVLVVGACTDYALLLVSRYRDELRHTAHPVDAMRAA